MQALQIGNRVSHDQISRHNAINCCETASSPSSLGKQDACVPYASSHLLALFNESVILAATGVTKHAERGHDSLLHEKPIRQQARRSLHELVLQISHTKKQLSTPDPHTSHMKKPSPSWRRTDERTLPDGLSPTDFRVLVSAQYSN
jgi:hypothetical protein